MKKELVLVYRTGHLGDTVCAIPTFRLIRNYFNDSTLALVCEQPSGVKVPAHTVVNNLGIFDEINTYESGKVLLSAWQIFRMARRLRPSKAIILPQARESSESVRRKQRFLRLCGIPEVRTRQIHYQNRDWHPSEAYRLIEIANSIGIIGSKPAYQIAVDKNSASSLEQKLASIGMRQSRSFLVFCGGGKVSTQHWPLERYADVLANLVTKTNLEIIGIGSPPELEQYRAHILPKLPSLRLLNEPLTISELFELCRHAKCYFGNDTGPMHIAAAVGCPVVVVMSARNAPGAWDPDVEPRLVIRHRTECEGCFLTECVIEKHRCMTEITTNHVLSQILTFLENIHPGDGL